MGRVKWMKETPPGDSTQRPKGKLGAEFVGSPNPRRPAATGKLSGQRRWSGLRPEMIGLGDGGADHGVLSGRLANRAFLGSVTRIAVDAGDVRLHANLATGAIVPGEGEAVTLSFPKSALHLLDDAA